MHPPHVVFVDIDGVLNHRAWLGAAARAQPATPNHLRWASRIDPAAVVHLNRLLACIPGLGLVFSTAWRHILESGVAGCTHALEHAGFAFPP